jgi:undecaprenyl diphosphate synthase
MTPPTSIATIPSAVRVSPVSTVVKKDTRVPRHLAIVLDASALTSAEESVSALNTTIQQCLKNGTTWLSVFVPSSMKAESLYSALAAFVTSDAEALAQNGVRFSALSPMTPAAIKNPPALCTAAAELLTALQNAERLAIANEALHVTLAVNYSGRADLVSAIRRLCEAATRGDLLPSDIGPQDLARSLCLRGMPPVDLLVRTGGETSLSDFLLWQSAYTELLFVETAWPQFRENAFASALSDYARRQRTFGALPGK